MNSSGHPARGIGYHLQRQLAVAGGAHWAEFRSANKAHWRKSLSSWSSLILSCPHYRPHVPGLSCSSSGMTASAARVSPRSSSRFASHTRRRTQTPLSSSSIRGTLYVVGKAPTGLRRLKRTFYIGRARSVMPRRFLRPWRVEEVAGCARRGLHIAKLPVLLLKPS